MTRFASRLVARFLNTGNAKGWVGGLGAGLASREAPSFVEHGTYGYIQKRLRKRDECESE